MLLIDAIAIVESGGHNRPGDKGEALSIFQIHEKSWEDVRNRIGLHPKIHQFLAVGDRFEDIGGDDLDSRMRARNCATGYMFILEQRLKHAHQPSTPENIYACWNLGFEGFSRRHFNLAHCPKTTRERAERVGRLTKGEERVELHRHE